MTGMSHRPTRFDYLSLIRVLLFGSYNYICFCNSVLFERRSTVSLQLWYEWLSPLNEYSPSDLVDEPFCVAK